MTDKPGICVVTQPIGATGHAVSNLVEILGAITQVSVVTDGLETDSPIRESHEVIDISRAGADKNAIVAAVRFLLNQLRMCQAISTRDEEFILFFGTTAYVIPILFSKLIGKTVIVQPRADVPLSLKLQWERRYPSIIAATLSCMVRVLERTGYWLANGIITYSSGMAEQLNLDRFEKKLYTNGARFVDTDQFSVTIPFDERENRVGFIGRFEEEKGLRTLAEAVDFLPAEYTFRFVGDGSMRDWLQSELSDEIQNGTVEIMGWVDHDDVPAELNKIKLLVMASSPTEGLPTLILESMACGTPVLAPPVSGIPDVVLDQETGYTYDNLDAVEISGLIDGVLHSGDFAKVGEQARAMIESDYTFESAIRRYRTILREISAERGSP